MCHLPLRSEDGELGMTSTTTRLFADALDAHGGLEQWRSFQKVSAAIVTGGFF
jgi:hypothetical protein